MATLYFAQGELKFQQEASKAQGIIKGHITSRGSEGGTMYSPQVTFEDINGRSHTFKEGWSSSSKYYDKDEIVEVFYISGEEKDAKINKGIWNFTFALIPGVFALIFFLLAIKSKKY